jgi:transcriptional antiterminator RfaH
MQRWYLVHTKPSGESLAQSNLERQRYEVYLPRVAQTVRHGERWRERVLPLFPRYLFVRLDEGRQSLRPVHSTVGVSGIVRFGTSYTVVPDRLIDELHARMDTKSGLHRLHGSQRFAPGSSVRITAGPFEGVQGIFERDAGEERVVVLLSLLGHNATVHVPAAFVHAAVGACV